VPEGVGFPAYCLNLIISLYNKLVQYAYISQIINIKKVIPNYQFLNQNLIKILMKKTGLFQKYGLYLKSKNKSMPKLSVVIKSSYRLLTTNPLEGAVALIGYWR